MPFLNKESIQPSLRKARAAIEAIKQQRDSAGQNSQRNAYDLKYQYASSLMAAIEVRDAIEIRTGDGEEINGPKRKQQKAAMDQVYENLAGLCVLNDIESSGEIVDSDEIRRRAADLGKNRDFRNAAFSGEGVDSLQRCLDYLHDEEKQQHINNWTHELLRGRVDYETTFDTLSVNLPPEEKEKLRGIYNDMARINESAKIYKYQMGYSPIDLYAMATDPKAKTDYDNAIEANKEFDLSERQRVSIFAYSNPLPGSMPAAIQRSYFHFLQFSDKDNEADIKAAEKRNQRIVTRLKSKKPADIKFQKEFVRNMINRMLSVPDEALSPTSADAALAFYRGNHQIIGALFEGENILASLGRDFHISDEVRKVLRHKAQLATQNLSQYRELLKAQADPRYVVNSIARNWDGLDIMNVMSSPVSEFPKDYVNAFNGIGLGKINAVGNGNLEQPDAARYDGLSIGDNDILSLTKPVAPGFWAKLFNTKAYRDYQQALSEYNENKAYHEAEERRKNDPQTQESARWREERNAEMSAHLDSIDRNAPYETAKNELMQQLNDTFSAIEHSTGNKLSRLDHVMIGSRTLRGVLQAEYTALHPDQDPIITGDSDGFVNFVNQSVTNGHAADLMLAGMANGVQVVMYKPDSKTGTLQMNPATGKPEHILSMPKCVSELDYIGKTYVKDLVTKDLKVDLKSPADARERLKDTYNCRLAVQQLNAINRTALSSPGSGNMMDQFFGRYKNDHPDFNLSTLQNPRGFGLGRTSLVSHTMAYLMSKHEMTPEQLRDPAYKPGLKADAGEYVLQQMTSPDGDYSELMKHSLNAMDKIVDYIDEKTKGVDLTQTAQVFSSDNECLVGMAECAHDLDQEYSHAMSEMKQQIIEKHNLGDLPDRERNKAVSKIQADLSTKISNVSIIRNMKSSCIDQDLFLTGSCVAAGKATPAIVDAEISRVKFAEAMAQGKPLSQCFTMSEAGQLYNIADDMSGNSVKVKENHVTNPDELSEKLEINDIADAREFGVYAVSGGLRRDCDVEMGETAFELTFTPKAQGKQFETLVGSDLSAHVDAPMLQ